MGFLATTEASITSGFTAVATTFGASLLGTFRPAFITGFIIWITFIAYEVAFGKSEDGFTYLFTKIGKIFFIGVLALWGWVEVADLLGGVKDGFVGSSTISTVLETNLIDPMVLLWDALWKWFGTTLAPLGVTDIGDIVQLLFTFAVVVIAYSFMTAAVAFFCAISLAMYLVANSVFILLLAIGPFFLLCLAFPFTQRFFETYIGNVMTSILAMAFTVLMVFFVANLFGLVNINTIVPTTSTPATASNDGKSLAVLFASRMGIALLITYLYYKVFDLAAALGGGLNMGNNMVGGVRSILRDLQRGRAGGSAAGSPNSIAQGSSAASGGSPGRAARGNSTFTGMAASALSPAISGIGGAALAGARNVGSMVSYGAGRVAGSAGRFAYNRYAQNGNSMRSSI